MADSKKYYAAIYDDQTGKWNKLAWDGECRDESSAYRKATSWLKDVDGPHGALFVDTNAKLAEIMNQAMDLAKYDKVGAMILDAKMMWFPDTKWKDVPSVGTFLSAAVAGHVADGRVSIVSTHGGTCRVRPSTEYIEKVLQPAEVDFTVRHIHTALNGGVYVDSKEETE